MDLTRDQVEQLRASRPWLRKRAQPYGRTLETVVREAGDMEFLLDAVDTGHVPEFEGIKMALDASICLTKAGARAEAAAGKHHIAQAWVDGTAEELRALAAGLLEHAEALDALGPRLGVAAG